MARIYLGENPDLNEFMRRRKSGQTETRSAPDAETAALGGFVQSHFPEQPTPYLDLGLIGVSADMKEAGNETVGRSPVALISHIAKIYSDGIAFLKHGFGYGGDR